MGEAGSEAGGVEHISANLLTREKAVKDAIDRGDAEIELDCFDVGPHLGLGQVCCDHWGRIYWYRMDTRKLVKLYDPTEVRTNRVDTAVVRQLNKSMDLNRNMKTAVRELQKHISGYVNAAADHNATAMGDDINRTLDEILRMS